MPPANAMSCRANMSRLSIPLSPSAFRVGNFFPSISRKMARFTCPARLTATVAMLMVPLLLNNDGGVRRSAALFASAYNIAGVFETNPPAVKSGCAVCEDGDPFSGCACPAGGSVPFNYLVLNDCKGGGQPFVPALFSICMEESSTIATSGGAYQHDDNVPGGLGCRVPNPFTNACTCPAPFQPLSASRTLMYDQQGGMVGSNIFWCLGSTVSDRFGGVYQVKDNGQCLNANWATGGCACPAGYSEGGIRAIVDGPFGSTIVVCRKAGPPPPPPPPTTPAPPPPPPPAGTVAVKLEESFMVKLTSFLLPEIITAVQNYEIPGMNQQHFRFNPFKLQQFSIGALAIGFSAPNVVTLYLNDLLIQVPYHSFWVMDRVLGIKISCHGHFYGTVDNTNFAVQLTLDNNNGKIGIASTQVFANFGTLDIHQGMDHALCSIAEWIIQLFLGNLDNLIKNLIIQKLPGIIQNLVQTDGNAAFAKLPLNIVGSPTATANSLLVYVDIVPGSSARLQQLAVWDHHALPFKAAWATPPIAAAASSRPPLKLPSTWKVSDEGKKVTRIAPALSGAQGKQQLALTASQPRALRPRLHNFPPRDIEFYFASNTANMIIANVAASGHLNLNFDIPANVFNTTDLKVLIPAAYAACPGCPVQFGFSPSMPEYPPTVTFSSNLASLTITDGVLSFNALKTPTEPVSLMQIYLNATLSVVNFTVLGATQNTIKFDVAMNHFDLGLKSSSVGPIDISLISGIIGFIITDVALPAFNAKFAGITIPPIDGFSLSQIVVMAAPLEFGGASNVNFP